MPGITGIPTFADDQKNYLRLIESSRPEDLPGIMEHVPSNLKSNPEFMFAATDCNPPSIKFMGDSLKRDKEFILKANEITPIAREFMDASLKNNPGFMSELAKKVSY